MPFHRGLVNFVYLVMVVQRTMSGFSTFRPSSTSTKRKYLTMYVNHPFGRRSSLSLLRLLRVILRFTWLESDRQRVLLVFHLEFSFFSHHLLIPTVPQAFLP
jgi:hypothetical protein